jgi:hypothetical protein
VADMSPEALLRRIAELEERNRSQAAELKRVRKQAAIQPLCLTDVFALLAIAPSAPASGGRTTPSPSMRLKSLAASLSCGDDEDTSAALLDIMYANCSSLEQLAAWLPRMQVCPALLRGAVAQHGPCCAAASVAAVVNALCGLHAAQPSGCVARYESTPANVDEVLELYRQWKPASEALRRPRPSTAPIGNGDIIRAVEMLCHRRGVRVRMERLVGRASSASGPAREIQYPINVDDSVALVEEQWRAVCAAVGRGSAAHGPDAGREIVLFHQTNHYAPVYGWREYRTNMFPSRESSDVDQAPVSVTRQLLTAPAGQFPKSWLSWSRAREILLSTPTYQILVARRVSALVQPTEDASQHEPEPSLIAATPGGTDGAPRVAWSASSDSTVPAAAAVSASYGNDASRDEELVEAVSDADEDSGDAASSGSPVAEVHLDELATRMQMTQPQMPAQHQDQTSHQKQDFQPQSCLHALR